MEKPSLRVVEGGSMDKQKALQAALDQIDKNFGKGSIMRLGANDKRIEVEAISTAVPAHVRLGKPLHRAVTRID